MRQIKRLEHDHDPTKNKHALAVTGMLASQSALRLHSGIAFRGLHHAMRKARTPWSLGTTPQPALGNRLMVGLQTLTLPV